MKVAAIFLVFAIPLVSGKIFTRCELAQALLACGIPRADLENWVCLVESESSRNTVAKHRNKNCSTDWGLFQINDKFWCKQKVAGNDCNVKCEDLLLDDISKSCTCALFIKGRQGFEAWNGWKLKCKDKPLPDLRAECNL